MGLLKTVTPPRRVISITTSDTTDVSTELTGFMVGVAGDVKVTTSAGTTVTLPALIAGVQYVLAVKRIWATGTTATGIIGFAL